MMPQAPDGCQWSVTMDGSFIETRLLDRHGHTQAKQSEIYNYRESADLAEIAYIQAQTILMRIMAATALGDELGCEVHWK